jgi:hypothetical protein
MIAELWETSRGPLFVSKLPGAVFDPDDDPNDPFAPPTAALSKLKRARLVGAQSTKGTGPPTTPGLDGPLRSRSKFEMCRSEQGDT